jgi:hypothetical protein
MEPTKNPGMATRRGKSGFEEMSERPGFRSTLDQREWLEDARIARGAMSLSEWLRSLAIEDGEKALKRPYPKRKPESATRRKK